MHRVPFDKAYKEWRNRARRHDRESIINGAVDILREPSADLVIELQKAPWLTLLMVKWVCQDKCFDRKLAPSISRAELDDLRQRLWEFPSLPTSLRHRPPLELL